MDGLTYILLMLFSINYSFIGSILITFLGIYFITYMILIKNKKFGVVK